MVEGFLQAESVRVTSPATILWVDPATDDSYRLAEVGGLLTSKSPKLPAFQCEGCGSIEVPPAPPDGDDEEEDEAKR